MWAGVGVTWSVDLFQIHLKFFLLVLLKALKKCQVFCIGTMLRSQEDCVTLTISLHVITKT